MQFFTYLQFLFFSQWKLLRDYVHQQGIRIIGDLPIYVSPWIPPTCGRSREFFQLDEELVPKSVAGVPPDYFTADGQLWGNPLYDWDAMREDGFGWWIRRIDGAGKLYDVIRIDHFRGFASYWSVPYGETTAKNGHWVTGPGMDLIEPTQRLVPPAGVHRGGSGLSHAGGGAAAARLRLAGHEGAGIRL